MKLLQLVNSKDALQHLLQKELPVKTAYRLARFIKQADKELEVFDEQRIKLIQKYGEEREDGQVIVSPKNMSKFTEELTELVNLDVDMVFVQFSLDELGEIDLTTADLMAIDYLIKD